MSALLLDLGNTRLKWRLGDAQGAVAWSDPAAHDVAAAWRSRGLPQPVAVYGASVVDALREQGVADAVAAAWPDAPAVQWVRSLAQGGGVRSAYAEPQRLGVDRFLAMVAARAQGLAPCVLVGAGTALTLDALAADGRHLGGLIAPGPQLMQQALLGATVQVRPDRDGRPVAAADNTADAVVSGCWGACAALVERFVRDLAPALGGRPRVLFGGGDGEALQALVPAVAGEPFADGVLRGLEAWSRSPTGAGDAA
jgi:type III pantothenate kinase